MTDLYTLLDGPSSSSRKVADAMTFQPHRWPLMDTPIDAHMEIQSSYTPYETYPPPSAWVQPFSIHTLGEQLPAFTNPPKSLDACSTCTHNPFWLLRPHLTKLSITAPQGSSSSLSSPSEPLFSSLSSPASSRGSKRSSSSSPVSPSSPASKKRRKLEVQNQDEIPEPSWVVVQGAWDLSELIPPQSAPVIHVQEMPPLKEPRPRKPITLVKHFRPY